MAENIELIAAKDLPTTEAEEVSVLCIDNGELKQKPGASFGGGGGYITVADSFDAENATGTISENYDNFIGVLLAGGSVWIDLMSAMGMFMRLMITAYAYQEETLVLISSMGGTEAQFTCPNGTWTPEV